MSKKHSDLQVLSEELTEMKEKYSSSSAELVVKQTELNELSVAYEQHKQSCSEELQQARQNLDKVSAEKEKQVQSSLMQLKAAQESISNLRKEVEEKTSCWNEERRLKEAEVRGLYNNYTSKTRIGLLTINN